MTHDEYLCPVKDCDGITCLTDDQVAKMKRERTSVCCPRGHWWHFTGKTDAQKKIERLEHQIAHWRRSWEHEYDEKQEWRVVAKTCPFGCGWRVPRKSKPESIHRAIVEHAIEQHGAVLFVPEEIVA